VLHRWRTTMTGMSREQAVPDDEVLLAAGGWTEVPSARILAKFAADDFCVVVVDSNGGLGGGRGTRCGGGCRVRWPSGERI
jgi:hypothetical protein